MANLFHEEGQILHLLHMALLSARVCVCFRERQRKGERERGTNRGQVGVIAHSH